MGGEYNRRQSIQDFWLNHMLGEYPKWPNITLCSCDIKLRTSTLGNYHKKYGPLTKGRWGIKGATQEITEMRAGFLFQSRQNLSLLYKLRSTPEKNMTEKEIWQHHREDRSGSELLIGDVIWE